MMKLFFKNPTALHGFSIIRRIPRSCAVVNIIVRTTRCDNQRNKRSDITQISFQILFSLYSNKPTSSGTGAILCKQAVEICPQVGFWRAFWSCLQVGWGQLLLSLWPRSPHHLPVLPSWSPPFKTGPTHCLVGEHGEVRHKNPFCFLSDAISFLAKMARLNTSFAHYKHF